MFHIGHITVQDIKQISVVITDTFISETVTTKLLQLGGRLRHF